MSVLRHDKVSVSATQVSFFVRSNSYSVSYAAFLTDHFTCLLEKKQNIRFGNMEIEFDNINKIKFVEVIKNRQ